MTVTYDLTTTIGQMRLLLGDPSGTSFTDEELNACYSITSAQMSGPLMVVPHGAPSDVLFYATAQAVDVLATRVANSKDGKSYQLGDYKITGKDQVEALQALAQRFRDAVDNMPAWGIVEENLTDFNQLTIIRNWVLRTEV
jgi:hypothetical protein